MGADMGDLGDLADLVCDAMRAFMGDAKRNTGLHGEPVMVAPIVEPCGGDRMLVMDDDGSGESYEVAWWVLDDYLVHLEGASGPSAAFGAWLSKQRRQRGRGWGA